MTRAESWLALGTVVAFAAILIPVALVVSRRQEDNGQSSRMRREYVAISLYQTDESGRLPASLLGIRRYLGDDGLYWNAADPWRNAPGPFPIDGALADSSERSPVRISDAYAPDFVRAGRLPKFDAADPRIALLADPWHGDASVDGQRSFDARVGGAVVRIVGDGSVRRAERRSTRLSDANDLFLSPSEPAF